MQHPRVLQKKIQKFRIALIRLKMSDKLVKRENFEKILAFKRPTLDLNVDILDFFAGSH